MGSFKRILIFCSALLVFWACRKSTNAHWDVDVALPVVSGVLNIKNFAGDSIFKPDHTGLLYVRLNRQVAAIKLDSLLKLPDTTVVSSFTNPSPLPLPIVPGQALPTSAPPELKFDISNGVALKRVDIRSGAITVKFSNDISEPMDLIYKIPKVTRNGEPFVISVSIPPGNNSLVKTYDLSGYSFNMQGLTGHQFNTIYQTYTLALSPNSPSLSVNPGLGAKVEVSYSEIIPEYVEGYFGQQTIDLPLDTVRFGLVDNFKASNFMLGDASMDFTILNEFGAEFSGSIGNNKSINTLDNKVIALNSNQISNININRATKAGSTVFPSIRTFSFRSDNSNIVPFISNLPDKLTYQGNIKLNPLGNLSGYNDFAFYNTGIRINANINIPLRFTADYFELRSEAKVNFENVRQIDDVNSGQFVISASNGFPFSARLQAYMYDGQNKLLDSLFVPGSNSMMRGELNSQNEVIKPFQSRILIPVNTKKVENLKKCKTIRIISRFVMPPNPPELKILEHYELKIDIIAELNYKVGLK